MIYNNKIRNSRKILIQKTKKEFESTLKNLKVEKKIIISKKDINNNKKIETIKKDKFKIILEYTESELNSLSFKEALKIDKRTFIQYYFSLLKKKQFILFSFYPNKDYNCQIIKSFLFFFFVCSDITVNALFFTDDIMHEIYIYSGSFNLSYQLPQIIYSF